MAWPSSSSGLWPGDSPVSCRRADPWSASFTARFDRLPYSRLIAGIFHNLAYVELQAGQWAKAAAMLAGALRIHKTLDRELGIVQTMVAFGALACDQGQFELAARLFGAAEAWRERLGQSVDPFDRIELAPGNVERLQRARSALGETFDRAWAEGRALSRDDALASAATLAPPVAEAESR